MKSDLNFELSEYIKLLRFKAKLNQEEVAKKLSISRQAYSSWENNPIKLDIETLLKIGIALNENSILNFFNSYVAKSNDNNTNF